MGDNNGTCRQSLGHSVHVTAVRGGRGQSMVETALVLPIIILLLMAIIDFGLLFNHYIVLSNATREAARKAAVGATDVDILTVVENMTVTLDDEHLTATVSPVKALRTHGVQVTVAISYDHHMLTPVIGAMFPNGFATLESKTVMRVE